MDPLPPQSQDLQPVSPFPAAGPLSRKQVLAASSPWVAAGLNLVPGLGTGYIYQRRWRAYWTTALLGSLWLGVDAMGTVDLGNPIPELLALSTFSAVEAFLAARRARMD